MKFPILIFVFIAVSASIHAQNPRITAGNPRTETYLYHKGGDSVRFTILGTNDTLQITEFYRSGKVHEISWRQDSSYRYNVLGQLTQKTFGLNKDESVPNDLTLTFYANGQIKSKNTHKNNVFVDFDFDREGTLLATTTTRNAPLMSYKIERDGQNILMRSKRTDTLSQGEEPKTIEFDTLYFDNGRLYKTSVTDRDSRELGTQYYNEDGSVAETILPDSLQLVAFKDNVDCYYGLKNPRGDTIIKPRFDRIESPNAKMWGAYSGEILFLFDEKGAPISLFPPNITHFNDLREIRGQFNWDRSKKNEQRFQIFDFLRRDNFTYPASRLYTFSQGGKYGVVDAKGTVLMSPQHQNLSGRSLLEGRFFHFEEREEYQLKKSGFLNINGKPLFSSDAYKTVMYAQYEDYFFLCEHPFQVGVGCTGEKNSDNNYVSAFPNRDGKILTFGLGTSDGTLVLERKYNQISHVKMSPLFVTSLYKKGKNDTFATNYDGIYDSRSKRWLLDSVGFKIMNNSNEFAATFFVVKELSRNKCGIMDTAGRYILPIAYDSIGVVDVRRGLFWVKKAGKYQIFDVNNGKPNLHKTTYDFLTAIQFSEMRNNIEEDLNYFIAQQKNKWGVVDADEKIIKSFDCDYVSKLPDYENGFISVKNGQATYFTLSSLPNPMPDFPHARQGRISSNKTAKYPLANNSERIFIINDTGKVLVSPQYKLVNGTDNGAYFLIEDDKKRKKLVFLKSGKQLDYPFDYRIAWANAACNLMIVKDSTEMNYGVVSTDGQMIMPCKNYGIAISNADSTVFFAKQDTPVFKRDYYNGRLTSTQIWSDSLNIEDNNWLMYNDKGVLLSDKPFRFPIDFTDSVGIGMKDNYFNLYKTDGSVLTPFSKKYLQKTGNTEGSQITKTDNFQVAEGFNNILSIGEMRHYALFYNQGLTPTLILTRNNGEILVNSGRYDGISKFYGRYALVTSAGKIGLIDTLGHEVIAPQDVRTYSGNLIDSLAVVNKNAYKKWVTEGKKGDLENIDLPVKSEYSYSAYHPDSLSITKPQRSILWHLLLDKSRLNTFKTTSDVSIERVGSRASASFFYFNSQRKRNNPLEHRKIIVGTKTVSFILEKELYSEANGFGFYNFYLRNNRWEDLQINDLLNIQGEKRWLMNDLITKKVKALKDQEIDCSNTAAFITVVENRWMLTKEGVDFCFSSTSNGDLVIVSFTWAELSPFLKLKIY